MEVKFKLVIIAFISTVGLIGQAQTKPLYLDTKAPLEQRVNDALSRMTLHEKILMLHAQSKFTSPGVPRLGICQLNMDDGPHGVREELEWNTWNPACWTNDSVVAFPSLSCLAASWNTNLSLLYGNAVSEEFAYRGKDIMLGPGVSMVRTPLCGRNFEYMGEDPYLTGTMVVPYIQGVQHNGVAACVKHFALNNQEINRFAINVHVSERALHEIYLPAFYKAVKDGGVWAVMGSYPLWNGVHMCQNDKLLNGILKRDWGFDGVVISDWGGVTDTWQAAMGGLDIEMGTFTDGKTKESKFGYNDYYLADPFEKLIREGKISESVLNDKVERILRTIFRTAMNPNRVIGSLCSENHYKVCQQIGDEGIVMLKNNGILPIVPGKYKKILVVGENAIRSLTKGGGSSELKTLKDISPLESLQIEYGSAVSYAQGYYSGRALYDNVDSLSPEKEEQLRKEALEKAKKADLIIFIGGLNKNTHQDCENGDRESYDLPYKQNELIRDLANIQKNIVVITFGGNAYATPWINKVEGLLHCWYLGSMSGESLVDIVSGKVSPSGKLPVTFAKKIGDYAYAHYGKEAYPGDSTVIYKEGIYTGYRWFDTKGIRPQFPFGYGLSYTKFRYGKAHLSATSLNADGNITLTIPVSNIGKCKGKEIVQLYIGEKSCHVDRPAKELKHFSKITLMPGETKEVTFTITPDDLKYYSEALHAWTVDDDSFKAYVGASSENICSTVTFEYR